MNNTFFRTVNADGREIKYILEQKNVKNLNLRIHKDGKVYMSANEDVSFLEADDFIIRKSAYIFKAIDQFSEMQKYQLKPKQYVSGETFYIMGRGVRLQVIEDEEEFIYSDGVYLFLHTKFADNFEKKKKMICKFLDEECEYVFRQILDEKYLSFQKYGVECPSLKIRNMDTRWGSCLTKKKTIILNKRLLEVPKGCIEYVIVHELCHLIHPNHSKQFYQFLAMMMPDWKERKNVLEKSAIYGL